MFQKILALVIIVSFIVRLLWQQRQRKLDWFEFYFWLIFWSLSAVAVLMLQKIDQLVARLGFSGSGIEVLLYIGFVVCLSFIFRLRLRLEKMDRQITTLVNWTARQQPLLDKDDNGNDHKYNHQNKLQS